MLNTRHWVMALIAAVLMVPLALTGTAPPISAQEPIDVDRFAEQMLVEAVEASRAGDPLLTDEWQSAALPGGRMSLMVELDGPSVVDMVTGRIAPPGGGAVPTSTDAIRAVHMGVIRQQSAVIDAARQAGAQLVGTFQVTLNGFHVRATPNQLAEIARLPGVRRISRAPILTLDNADVAAHTRAADVISDLGFDGTGTTVAIIDTGVDYTHAAFGGPGTTEAYQGNDPDIVEEGTFPTAKVVGGKDFVGAQYSPGCPDNPQPPVECHGQLPDDDPLDNPTNSVTSGHGTHVAGTAAAMAVGDVPAGMAPGANIVALKVFGTPVGAPASTEVSSEAVEWAAAHNLYIADPDSDMVDGGIRPDTPIDVINMSLGSPYGPEAQAANRVIQGAVDAGITVVISAGNSGDAPYIVGSPSTSLQALTVSNTHARNTQGGRVTGSWTDTSGQEQSLNEIANTHTGWAGDLEQPLTSEAAYYGLGCNDREGEPEQDVTEKIAVIERGACTFVEKVTNAEANGALGVVIFSDARPRGGMGGECEEDDCPTIPVLMIDREPGLGVRDALQNGVVVTLTMEEGTVELLTDTIAPGSSRGPARFSGLIKPNISAPGQSTVSVGSSTGDGTHTLSGTSMSGPAVAGIAALLRQRSNQEGLELAPVDISALAMNYSQPLIRDGRNDTGPLVGVNRQGAGLVDALTSATAGTLVRSDQGIAELSFAEVHINDNATLTAQRFISVTNLTETDKSFSIEHGFLFPEDEAQGVDWDLPERIDVSSGETVEVEVSLVVDGTQLRDWNSFSPFPMSNRGQPIELFDGRTPLEEFSRQEIDGYLQLTEVDGDGNPVEDGDNPRIPFHVMPRAHTCVEQLTDDDFSLADAESEVQHAYSNACGQAVMRVHNLAGVDPLESEIYDDHPGELDIAAVGVDFAKIEIGQADGTTRESDTIFFHIATPRPRRTAWDGLVDIFVDVDGDGTLDRAVRQFPTYAINAPTDPDIFTEFAVISAPLAEGTLIPQMIQAELSGGLFMQFDIDESITTLAIETAALNPEWTLDDGDLQFEFAVALRDWRGDYEITDTFIGEDLAPDDTVDGGRFVFDQATFECLVLEGSGNQGPVNLIGGGALLPAEVENATATLKIDPGCTLEERAEVGVLSQFRGYANIDNEQTWLSNEPSELAWSIRRGTIGQAGSTTAYLPYLANQHDLRPEASEPDSSMRIIHASPGAPAVDVQLDGTMAYENVPYGTAGQYIDVIPGTRQLTVFETGTESPALIDAEVDIQPVFDYTVLAVGAPDQIEPWVLEDDNGEPGEGTARVRFLHASPGAPAVKVTTGGGGITLFDGVSYKESGGYQPVAPGTYQLNVRSAENDEVLLPLNDVTFADGGVYTVVAIGLPGGDPGLSAMVLQDAAYRGGQ